MTLSLDAMLKQIGVNLFVYARLRYLPQYDITGCVI